MLKHNHKLHEFHLTLHNTNSKLLQPFYKIYTRFNFVDNLYLVYLEKLYKRIYFTFLLYILLL